MQWKYLWLVLLFAFSSASGAEDEDYKICTVGGYFSGTGDKFLSGLAAHLASKKRILTNPICVAVWKNSHAFGVHHSRTGKIESDAVGIVVQQASEFSAQVYDAVSANISP
jgi:hypothetical protein